MVILKVGGSKTFASSTSIYSSAFYSPFDLLDECLQNSWANRSEPMHFGGYRVYPEISI
jgi:hypothetical protein